jgi:hypothetical protein
VKFTLPLDATGGPVYAAAVEGKVEGEVEVVVVVFEAVVVGACDVMEVS